jgi:S-adenosylmethionine:tRNA ribosyltransferase-isomerase
MLDHEMHAEVICVNKSLVDTLTGFRSKVISVGTTTLRTLESLYWIGVKILQQGPPESDRIHLDQWEAYKLTSLYSPGESFDAIKNWMNRIQKEEVVVTTRLMIIPGYEFKTTDTLITNFHQPRSTLLMLIAAFIGESWKETYKYAMEHDFRFLSYGDSSLLFGGQ